MRMRRELTAEVVVLILALLAGCSDRALPEPLGRLPRTDLDMWRTDCRTMVVEEQTTKGPDPEMEGMRQRELPFQQATHRFFCGPPGWSVYVGAADRVVGICVDDDLRSQPIQHSLDRGRSLLAKHFGAALASEIAVGAECPYRPERTARGLVRWEQRQPYIKNPDGSLKNLGSHNACCWEVAE